MGEKTGVQRALESLECVTDTVDREEGSSFEIHVRSDTTIDDFSMILVALPALMFPMRISETDDGYVVHCLQYEEVR
ncbi:hypothetical protein HUG10_20690 (plasmid) [Halorarum halophilum]|uniref:Uncharacterized protein n=1 Tax=Halorarum halophilum TaxID=2743090 RepID=A0A7D5GER5_9EURY|nr:hypothetical protein [Halobaculum halophilum]QLG30026.1 hypothetical protein HUG10_20690 [Halobaculum halophilum]